VTAESANITGLLRDWSHGDAAALEELLPIVYAELRRVARRELGRERIDHILQPTALVNELYLRLVQQRSASWENRAQFFAIAARLVRRILVDHARTKHRDKRGGGAKKVSLDDQLAIGPGQDAGMIALDEALNALAQVDRRKSDVVEMKFFGGLSVEEIGRVLGISSVTVMRDWNFAKAWLYRELSGERTDGPADG